MLCVVGPVVEAGARRQALNEFLSLIEGRDLLLIHAEKQVRQLQRKLSDKQASYAEIFADSQSLGSLSFLTTNLT